MNTSLRTSALVAGASPAALLRGPQAMKHPAKNRLRKAHGPLHSTARRYRNATTSVAGTIGLRGSSIKSPKEHHVRW